MRSFAIQPTDTTLAADVQHKIDQKTKPVGALGQLEQVALQVSLIQHTLTPELTKPTVIVFAGDHGITAEPVAPYPQAVTVQMVQNFLHGGAAINVFARQHNLNMVVVNAGVASDLADAEGLVNIPVGKGTKNFLHEPAMTPQECELAMERGADIVRQQHEAGCNTLLLGEMGIGNTSSAAAIMSTMCGMPVAECVGRGTGSNDAQLAKKVDVLERAVKTHGSLVEPLDILATFGGFETAMMVGAMLQAAELKMVILIDGFIVTSALLIAHALHKDVLDYCIFAHVSNEKAHAAMLEYLKVTPLLHLGMRLGEGSGAAVAYPLVQSSVLFLDHMASFESAGVSERH